MKALEQSVDVSTNLFQGAWPDVKYLDVLFAQRDLLEARTVLIETKQQQLTAIVNAYQALGGGCMFLEEILQIVDGVEQPIPESPFDDASTTLPRPTASDATGKNEDTSREDETDK